MHEGHPGNREADSPLLEGLEALKSYEHHDLIKQEVEHALQELAELGLDVTMLDVYLFGSAVHGKLRTVKDDPNN
jgi:hypothetical protein